MWTWPLSFNFEPFSHQRCFKFIPTGSEQMRQSSLKWVAQTHTLPYIHTLSHLHILSSVLPLPARKNSPNTFSMLYNRVTTSKSRPFAVVVSARGHRGPHSEQFFVGENRSHSSILLFPLASWDRDIIAEAARRSCTVLPLLRFSCFSAIISTLLDCFYLSSQYSWG